MIKFIWQEMYCHQPYIAKVSVFKDLFLLFNYFHNMQDIQTLDIQKLTHKLVILMAIFQEVRGPRSFIALEFLI